MSNIPSQAQAFIEDLRAIMAKHGVSLEEEFLVRGEAEYVFIQHAKDNYCPRCGGDLVEQPAPVSATPVRLDCRACGICAHGATVAAAWQVLRAMSDGEILPPRTKEVRITLCSLYRDLP